MESAIKKRFHPELLAQGCAAFGLDPEALKPLDGFESYVYLTERQGEKAIFRFSHSLHRQENHLLGEMDFIDYLHGAGARVAMPLRTEKEELVCKVEDNKGGCFFGSLFVHADGQPAEKVTWDENFLFAYGRALGQMHRLTKDYKPSSPDWSRPDWDDPELLDIVSWLPPEDAFMLKPYNRLRRSVEAIPKTREHWGLLHFDAHRGNFFVAENNRITLFDFDDSCYGWFVDDLAIVLFHARFFKDSPEDSFAAIVPAFSRGYAEENNFEPQWLSWFHDFLCLREIDLYAVIQRSYADTWAKDKGLSTYMNRCKKRVLAGGDFTTFDFEKHWVL